MLQRFWQSASCHSSTWEKRQRWWMICKSLPLQTRWKSMIGAGITACKGCFPVLPIACMTVWLVKTYHFFLQCAFPGIAGLWQSAFLKAARQFRSVQGLSWHPCICSRHRVPHKHDYNIQKQIDSKVMSSQYWLSAPFDIGEDYGSGDNSLLSSSTNDLFPFAWACCCSDEMNAHTVLFFWSKSLYDP